MFHSLSVFVNHVFVICFMNYILREQLLIFFFYSFSWDRLWRIIFMKFFNQNWCVFFIIMYDFHVLHSYSSHLIRSSNHVNFVFYFMSSIKSTKYESSLFSTIVSCNDDTCLLIRSSFENHNRLMWNVE